MISLGVLLLVASAQAQDVTGADLRIVYCNASNPLQRWSLPGQADGTIRLLSNTSACISSVPFGDSQRTLSVLPCGSSGNGVVSQRYT
jgi:hypothetical protein